MDKFDLEIRELLADNADIVQNGTEEEQKNFYKILQDITRRSVDASLIESGKLMETYKNMSEEEFQTYKKERGILE